MATSAADTPRPGEFTIQTAQFGGNPPPAVFALRAYRTITTDPALNVFLTNNFYKTRLKARQVVFLAGANLLWLNWLTNPDQVDKNWKKRRSST